MLLIDNIGILDMYSEEVRGIPILTKISKGGEVKSIASIPYYSIATFLSNVGGDTARDPLSLNQSTLRLAKHTSDQYINNQNADDNEDIFNWYSIDSLLKYFNKDKDKCKGHIVAWYNPYSRDICCFTDIDNNKIEVQEKDKLSDLIVRMYNEKILKYNVNCFFTINPFNFRFPTMGPFSLNTLTKIGRNLLCAKLMHDNERLNLFKDTYRDESGKELSSWCALEAALEITFDMCLEMQFVTREYSRYKVALNIFRQNSILAFRAISKLFGGNQFASFASDIARNHFSGIPKDNMSDITIYTDALYRNIALCIGFTSVAYLNVKSRIDNMKINRIICGVGGRRGYPINDSAAQNLSNLKIAARAFMLTSYSTETIVNNILDMFECSPYIISDGTFIAFYNGRKEFYI